MAGVRVKIGRIVGIEVEQSRLLLISVVGQEWAVVTPPTSGVRG